MAFKDDKRREFIGMDFEELMDICIKEGHQDWLKEALSREIPHYRYQKSIVEIDGKKKKIVNKALPMKLEYRKPTFVELKEMFFVEICGFEPAKKKEKPVSMADRLAARLAKEGK